MSSREPKNRLLDHSPTGEAFSALFPSPFLGDFENIFIRLFSSYSLSRKNSKTKTREINLGIDPSIKNPESGSFSKFVITISGKTGFTPTFWAFYAFCLF